MAIAEDRPAAAGIDLVAVSSFRDFERQLHIWNGKWRGERPLLDRAGHPLDAAALDKAARIEAILCWSALPGGSRHHWGTDCDLIDAAALPEGHRVQLVAQEYAPGGVFERLTPWLDENMGRFGFYRPYASAHCGAGTEPWHVSYWPVASEALEKLTLPVLRHALAGSAILGKAQVLERLPWGPILGRDGLARGLVRAVAGWFRLPVGGRPSRPVEEGLPTINAMDRVDVCVRGSGAVGASMALALARHGLLVAITRPRESGAGTADVRAYALNAASRALLTELRVWEALPADAVKPVHEMRVAGDAPAGTIEFSSWQQAVDALAWIVDAAELEAALHRAIGFAPHVRLVDRPVEAGLTVWARPKSSPGM